MGLVRAQSLGDRPLRIILPLSAGSGADGSIRAISNSLAKALGQPVYNLLGGKVHERLRSYTYIYPDESKHSAEAFLRCAVAYFERLDVSIQRVLTDNGKSFHSALFASTCLELGISQKFTRAYRPQTNGKAERFIQSALREWAYGHAYLNSDQRRAALPLWNHFYNWHRPHHGIGCQTPSSRLPRDGNNVLTLHTWPTNGHGSTMGSMRM